jgi:hypothetical protein
MDLVNETARARMYLEALLDFLHEHVPVRRKTVDGEHCAVRSTKES